MPWTRRLSFSWSSCVGCELIMRSMKTRWTHFGLHKSFPKIVLLVWCSTDFTWAMVGIASSLKCLSVTKNVYSCNKILLIWFGYSRTSCIMSHSMWCRRWAPASIHALMAFFKATCSCADGVATCLLFVFHPLYPVSLFQKVYRWGANRIPSIMLLILS